LSYVMSDYQNMTGLSSYIATWSCLDSLGCGALLAMAHRALSSDLLDRWLGRRILPAALALGVLFALPVAATLNFVMFAVVQAVVFAALIHLAARGLRGWVGRVLEFSPITYLGRISYGIYVYHPFMKEGAREGVLRIAPQTPEEGWAVIACALAATLIVSSLSWALLERPLNRLKRHASDPMELPPLIRESSDGTGQR
jgi:peptidoglycan/LPS O-acetylase OafA/YrhL